MKRRQKQLQARLKALLRECAIEGSWTLKVFRQNAAMAALEREQARTHTEAATRQLQHAPGSKAPKEYILEPAPTNVAPASLCRARPSQDDQDDRNVSSVQGEGGFGDSIGSDGDH